MQQVKITDAVSENILGFSQEELKIVQDCLAQMKKTEAEILGAIDEVQSVLREGQLIIIQAKQNLEQVADIASQIEDKLDKVI